jgi:hypothetical protein
MNIQGFDSARAIFAMIAAPHCTGCTGDLQAARRRVPQISVASLRDLHLLVNTPPTSKRRPRAIRMGSALNGPTDAFRPSVQTFGGGDFELSLGISDR